MVQSSIATAADYADAMLTARRARNLLFALLLIVLLLQLGLFCTARFTTLLDKQIPNTVATPGSSVTVTPANQAKTKAVSFADKFSGEFLQYLVGATDFLGMAFVMVLSIVLLLMVLVMVVGRLIGVSQVTSAFLWCVLLAALLFPWQAFLNYPGVTGADFKIPGVLYTWNELRDLAHFPTSNLHEAVLKWARFVGFPVLAIVLLIVVQAKSGKGLKIALGEAELELEPHAKEQQP